MMPSTREEVLAGIQALAIEEAEKGERDEQGDLTPEAQKRVQAILGLADDPEILAQLANE